MGGATKAPPGCRVLRGRRRGVYGARRVAERARALRYGSQVSLRPEPSVVQLPGGHRSSSRGCRVVVSAWRLRAKQKGPGGWSRPGLGSREVVEDQDVTATSATRPKSRVATRASVQQHSVARCIVTAWVCAPRCHACQGSRAGVLYRSGSLWRGAAPCAASLCSPSYCWSLCWRVAKAQRDRPRLPPDPAPRHAPCASRWMRSTSWAGCPPAGS